MSYLIDTSRNHLLLIDYHPRNGLYYRAYSKNKPSQTKTLHLESTKHYAVCKDMTENIHIVLKTKGNELLHLSKKLDAISQNTLLTDAENNYNISNLALTYVDEPYLFYAAKNPENDDYNLIFHPLESETVYPQSVASICDPTLPFECQSYKSTINLLSISKEDNIHYLNLATYDCLENQWDEETLTLSSSNSPILFCTFTIDGEGTRHYLYVTNHYGYYELYYGQYTDSDNKVQLIHTTNLLIKPILCIYHNDIWINWQEKEENMMMLSLTHGEEFSDAKPTSTEGENIKRMTYLNSTSLKRVYGQDYFVKLEKIPEICLLNEIDVEDLIQESQVSKSFSLYRNTVEKQLNHLNNIEQLDQENFTLKQTQENIVSKYNELTELTKKIQDEGKHWRTLYQKNSKKLKKLEQELKLLKTVSIEPTEPTIEETSEEAPL